MWEEGGLLPFAGCWVAWRVSSFRGSQHCQVGKYIDAPGATECLSRGHACKVVNKSRTKVGCGGRDWFSSYLPANTGSGCAGYQQEVCSRSFVGPHAEVFAFQLCSSLVHHSSQFGRICTHTTTGNDMVREDNTLLEDLTLPGCSLRRASHSRVNTILRR